MKIFMILLIALSLVSLIGCAEPDLSSAYAMTPYDRCMEAHEGTAAASQCDLLKL